MRRGVVKKILMLTELKDISNLKHLAPWKESFLCLQSLLLNDAVVVHFPAWFRSLDSCLLNLCWNHGCTYYASSICLFLTDWLQWQAHCFATLIEVIDFTTAMTWFVHSCGALCFDYIIVAAIAELLCIVFCNVIYALHFVYILYWISALCKEGLCRDSWCPEQVVMLWTFMVSSEQKQYNLG